jgi:signal transduction histidine kinase
MIKKLRRKFVLINMLLVSLILVFVFIALCLSTHARLRFDTENAAEAALIGESMPDAFRPEIGRPRDRHRDDFMRDIPTFTVRVSADGAILYVDSSRVSISESDVKEAVNKALSAKQNRGVINDLGLRYVFEILPNGETAIAFADTYAESNGMQRLIISSLLIGIPALIALFFVSLFLAGLAIKPVETAWRSQQQFIADASHELKTPLTVILANTGILTSHPNAQISEHMKWIDSTVSEAARMKSLVENMLELAKGDFAEENLIHNEVNLSDVVTNSLLSFEPVAFEASVELVGETEPNLKIQGNDERLHKLTAILIDNAIKYAGRGGNANVKLSQSGSHILLSVQNTGAVIPPEHLPHLFDRFYRVDESRSTGQEGSFGLGLSIAKQITDEHGAKIWAESDRESETTFTVQFKK